MSYPSKCTFCEQSQLLSLNSLLCNKCHQPLDLFDFNPISKRSTISLGEGNTPIIHLKRLGDHLGLSNLFGKLEFMNPTGSFKDRGSALLVTMLKKANIDKVAEDSSGNAGASIAAYCAKAGIQATIFAPASAPRTKLEQIAFYGALIRMVDGTREQVTQTCKQFCEETNTIYASHNLNPFFIEGTRSFGYEVTSQMITPPDHILFPVGNGSLLIGAWKEYSSNNANIPAGTMPRLHCIQSQSCMPIVIAHNSESWMSSDQKPITVAGGIAVENPPRLQQVLQALEESKGRAVAVKENDIIRWHKYLSLEEGMFVEPTSAAPLAGLERLLQEGEILPKDRILIPLTGFGFKDRIPIK